jgi:uncharacterized protein YjiS (DUF1127 family)
MMEWIINIRLLHRSSRCITAPPKRQKSPAEKGKVMTRFLSGRERRITGPFDLLAAARSVWTLVKGSAQRIRNRRAVMQLLDWDDHALRDIGLTRADIRLSLGMPLGEDPSMQLMSWAQERRSARTKANRGYDGPIDAPQLRLVSGRSRSSVASISR